MDTDKKKRTLREAYDAALKGEEYGRKLNGAKQAVNVVEAKVLLLGGVTVAGNLLIASIILPDDASSLMRIVAGLMSFVASYVMISIAWRMLRGNVYAKVYEDVDNQPADQDGVKRTDAERELLLGNFGVGQRMVITTRNLYDGMRNDYSRAVRWTGNTPEAIGVGNALARCLHNIDNMQRDLDVDFARGEARAATLLSVSLAMQKVVLELMGCLPFVSKHLFNHE
ncbi:MAG: hypothetical protein AAB663_01170 [Patescibacteria group bacterium]